MSEIMLPQITVSSVIQEQETALQFDRMDEDAELFTTDPTVVTKLNKMVEKYPETYRYRESTTGAGIFYRFPKRLITFRAPASQAMRERGMKLAEFMTHRKDDGNEEDA